MVADKYAKNLTNIDPSLALVDKAADLAAVFSSPQVAEQLERAGPST